MQAGRQKLWSIGGGKGKSFLTAHVATALARSGKSVLAVDADTDDSKLHDYLGIKTPAQTLADYLENRVPAKEVLLETAHPSLRMISRAGEILSLADPASTRKEKIISLLTGLDAEYIVVDLGAKISTPVLDFFNFSDEGIVLVAPDPASMQNAYEFVKGGLFRKIERNFGSNQAVVRFLREIREDHGTLNPRSMVEFFDLLCSTDREVAEKVANIVSSYRPLIMVNLAKSEEDRRVAKIIQATCSKFLDVEIGSFGLVVVDPNMRQSPEQGGLLDFDDPKCVPARQILRAVATLVNRTEQQESVHSEAETKPAAPAPIMGLNDNVELGGREIHVQTEDMGGRYAVTQIFCDGRILKSTKSEYPAEMRDDSQRSHKMEFMRQQHRDALRDVEKRKAQIVHPA
jgi:flagellar biosynthesis protein FlhG